MTFPWLSKAAARPIHATFTGKAKEAVRNEVRDRAGLLMRLGHSKATAARRIKATLAWEWELNGKSPVQAEVDKLVGEIFGRAHK